MEICTYSAGVVSIMILIQILFNSYLIFNFEESIYIMFIVLGTQDKN